MFDWLDILLIMVGLSAALLIAGMLAASKREGSKLKKFLDAVTVFTASLHERLFLKEDQP